LEDESFAFKRLEKEYGPSTGPSTINDPTVFLLFLLVVVLFDGGAPSEFLGLDRFDGFEASSVSPTSTLTSSYSFLAFILVE
jgi:hypothetical protein